MGIAFGATKIESWPLFIFWVVSVSTVFGFLGIIIGLWSKSFEQLNMPVVFFLTPLSMVGGVFNTTAMLPDWLRWLAWANPFFYFINGIRGAMIGFDETPPGLGIAFTLALLLVLGVWVWRLYSKGYGLRE
jgi:ABC-2 type transport system permease protein